MNSLPFGSGTIAGYVVLFYLYLLFFLWKKRGQHWFMSTIYQLQPVDIKTLKRQICIKE